MSVFSSQKNIPSLTVMILFSRRISITFPWNLMLSSSEAEPKAKKSTTHATLITIPLQIMLFATLHLLSEDDSPVCRNKALCAWKRRHIDTAADTGIRHHFTLDDRADDTGGNGRSD